MDTTQTQVELQTDLSRMLGLKAPIFQAPMAGVSCPAMAAAVSNAGGLGALGIGASSVEAAQKMIAETRVLTDGPFNVNVFCHQPAQADPAREAAWLSHLAPAFARFEAVPPTSLCEIYTSFVVDDAMQKMLIAARPAVVSFHFGLPSADVIRALQEAGSVVIGSATSIAEARVLQDAGLQAVIAQGWEAGGHRGVFDPDAADEQLSTLDLTEQLVQALDIPVIAAGGIMSGDDIAAAIASGAQAAQLGTVFVGSEESLADSGYRAALQAAVAGGTQMTAAISGRPARCLENGFTALAGDLPVQDAPDYPIAYDAGKALNAAAKAKGDFGFGAQWAGMGAARARTGSAAEIFQQLMQELHAARAV